MTRRWGRWLQLQVIAADGHQMERPDRNAPGSITALLMFVAMVLVISACAGARFERSDAVLTLQTTGVTEAQASCMADSLIALDLLHAADPRVPRTAVEQEALVTASARCASLQTPSVGPDAPSTEVLGDSESNAREQQAEREFLVGNAVDEKSDGQLRAAALDRLTLFGVPDAKAACIVDRLLAADAGYLLEDPDFGRGLDSLEASAFASCI